MFDLEMAQLQKKGRILSWLYYLTQPLFLYTEEVSFTASKTTLSRISHSQSSINVIISSCIKYSSLTEGKNAVVLLYTKARVVVFFIYTVFFFAS